MIKLEHVVLPSPEQMEFIIEGMRNPMNSWEKSDSFGCDTCKNSFPGYDITMREECGGCCSWNNKYIPNDDAMFIGPNDYSLMQRLANAGTDHRKFMRMMPVYVRITAPLYWLKELDTYKVGTVANSCSTMHKIQEKEFTLEDFSSEHLFNRSLDALYDIIEKLNFFRHKWILIENVLEESTTMSPEERKKLKEEQKDIWWQMIQLLPSSYNQTRNVMLNYEVLANIYKSRKNHKLDEWREFCKWIESLPYSELIKNTQMH